MGMKHTELKLMPISKVWYLSRRSDNSIYATLIADIFNASDVQMRAMIHKARVRDIAYAVQYMKPFGLTK